MIPPTPENKIEEAVSKVMEGFDENHNFRYGFFDYWNIGGRFSGAKLQAKLDPHKLASFHEELNRKKVTVSSITLGKQSLSPESQIPFVDALWRDYFPGTTDQCPIFSHFKDAKSLDICRLDAYPENHEATRMIFADYSKDGTLTPVFMLEIDSWNGVNLVDTTWDGRLHTALSRLAEYFKRTDRDAPALSSDWLSITVDYHS
jgi:hypothetical protein